jgi:50S ribosomal protein L16 3-hydroxylase
MDAEKPLPLLGGLSPRQFMNRHWQKKPLLVRQAVPGMRPLLSRARLFALAGRDGVESRLVQERAGEWTLAQGPFARRALPPLTQPAWSLLVQGVDLHEDTAHELLGRFRFVPDARLDDLMISFATEGGGVGPHFDSYDVFLLQAQGKRRWRIGRQKNLGLRDDLPLKVLADFRPEEEFVLEPGDMLYLPPRYAHDGVAVDGECMTCSIGFRAPSAAELAREVLQKLAEDVDGEDPRLYRDPQQDAVASPGAIPTALQSFAREALEKALREPHALERALGEYLTEPKASVWFDPGGAPRRLRNVSLDRRTRMMHDRRHIFVNGESWRAAGADATLMRRLADRRGLDAGDLAGASEGALDLIRSWCEAGWAHGS